jgi:hypothetical protein
MLAGNKKVSGHRFARTRLVVLARNLVFTPVGQLEPGMLETTSSTGTLGNTPERTQLVVLARNSFSTKHQFKHTSLQKDQLCADTIVCVLNKTWTRSKLQKVFLNAGREDMPHSLSAGTPLLSATRSTLTLYFLKNWVH